MDILALFIWSSFLLYLILKIINEKYRVDSKNKIKLILSILIVSICYIFSLVYFIFINEINIKSYEEINSKKQECFKSVECQSLLNKILTDDKISRYEEIQFNLLFDKSK